MCIYVYVYKIRSRVDSSLAMRSRAAAKRPELAVVACGMALEALDELASGETVAVSELLAVAVERWVAASASGEGSKSPQTPPPAGLRRALLDMLCFLASELRLEVSGSEADEQLARDLALVRDADAFDVNEAEFKLWVISDEWHADVTNG